MNALALRISILIALLGLGAAGCGGPIASPDGGTAEDASADDGGDPRDAGDITAPTVIATSPIDGASLVDPATTITVAFSEPMDTSAGSLLVESDGGAITLGAPSWSDDGTSVTVAPQDVLPTGAAISVTVGTTFHDLAGNALAAATSFFFTTEDTVPPTIVRTAPVDGSVGVDPALAAIEIELSEPMDVSSGRLRIEGPGTPVLGAITWMDRTARVAVSDLIASSRYRVFLDGFADTAGNPLDRAALGENLTLDFDTGADTVPPRIVTSTPREGQLDVDVGLITQIAIELSEPMNEAAGTFTLEVGGESVALVPRWDRGSRRVLLSVTGRLAAAAPHRIVVDGLRDLAGNALDGTAYLIDGALDFTTGSDLFVPFVAFTSPEEGAVGVPGGVLSVVVVFSEVMDASTTTAPMTGDGATITLSGTWSSGNTVLTLAAPTMQAGRSYQVDLRGFRDAGGTMVDATHAYLGDGIASFALAAPRGETCGDALTENEAMVVGGQHTWVIAPSSVTRADGSAPCDLDGHGADALVRFRKTTPAARDGGTTLHVRVTPATSTHNFDVDILAGDCRAGEPVGDAARLRCLVERPSWEQWLDVGPGDYFVWVARDGSSTFTGATVVIDEVPGIREGESCEAPLGVTAPGAIYTAPTMPGQPHRWALPAGFGDALDRGRTHTDPVGTVSCMPAGSARGHDSVVQYDKASSTSLVTVRVSIPTVSGRHGAVEIARGCDPAGAPRAELACLPYSSSAIDRELTFDGPAGPISAWLVERRSLPLPAGGWGDSPATTIEVTEFEPGPGDTCATAIPITPGTNAVTAARPWRAHVPACLASGGVTWFRYTPTQGLGVLRTNVPTTGAVVERASGRMLRCQSDETGTGLPVFGLPGQEVCVALSSNAGITQLTLEEIPYGGVRGVETELFVTPAPPEPGDTLSPSLGGSGWWARQGDSVWSGRFRGLFSAPVTGHVAATYVSTEPFTCRYAGMARPDGLYCLSETSAATTPRLYRVVDATGNVLATPVPIDVLPEGFAYAAQRMDGLAFDGTSYVLATVGTSSGDGTTSFYSVPAGGGAPTLLGTSNVIDGLGALALDADYLYVSGRSNDVLGIWRLRRDQLSNPDQVPVQLVDGYVMTSFGGQSIAVDSTVAATALYFRPLGNLTHRADIVLVVDPRGDAPRWVGPLWRAPGNRQDNGFGLDPTGPTIWFLHTNGTGGTSGRWVRLD